MSVFDLPRLHFRGVAITRLPTGPRSGLIDLVGNRALTDEGPFPVERPVREYHEYLDRRGPRFDAAGRVDPNGVFSASKGWNFGGNGHFWVDARIVSAETDEGMDRDDPVVGRPVDLFGHYNEYLATTVNRARVFDIDPTSEWTTTLMVGQFCFGRAGRSHDTGYMIIGAVRGSQPPRWHQPDHVRDVGEHFLAAQMRRSVLHQFVVTKDEGLRRLPRARSSAVVTRLLARIDSGEADGLVVQLALSNMAAPTAPDQPDRWDVRGTIALWRAQEMRTYPAGRLLTARAAGPAGPRPALHDLTVDVRSDRVGLNLITAVPVTGRAAEAGDGPTPVLGPRCDLGDLELLSAGSGRLVARVPAAAYLGPGYDLTSGIVTVPAGPGAAGAGESALYLVGRPGGGPTRLLAAEEEINLQVDEAGLILEHPDPRRGDDHAVEVPLRSYVRGRPAAVETVHVRQYTNPASRPLDHTDKARCGEMDIVAVRAGRPADPGDFTADCTTRTDDRGQGWFTVRGRQAGAGRVLLSAHADDRPCDPAAAGSAATAYDPHDELGYWSGAGSMNLRVLPDDWHLDDLPPEEVDFDLVYREVFAYYELLYAFMRAEVFSLADECKVTTYSRLIWQMCDPRNKPMTYYMPPTRDLSAPKARLLLTFMRSRQEAAAVPVVLAPAPRSDSGITARGELLRALRQAAAIEHAVMLQYLYAAYSVPTYAAGLDQVRRGLWTPAQLGLACGDGDETRAGGIRGTLLTVAREEMIHFLLINNIIMAMGEAFHVPLLDFGTINRTLPVPLDFALEPLSIGSVQRFIAIEQPADQLGEVHRNDDAVPAGSNAGYRSLSELYADIRAGLQRVPDVFLVRPGRGGGEHHLFLRESINAVHPDYQLEVDDLPSALFAIDVVTEQGEGNQLSPVDVASDSHFDSFLRMSEVLMAEQMAGPRLRRAPWTPAYPVVRNPTLRADDMNREPVTDPDARAVMQLFDRSYFMMFQLMVQHFGQTPDASLRRSRLMNAAIDVMTGMMSPLAQVLVTMPSGVRGRTAGPGFELDEEPRHQARPDIAARATALRFDHLARAARRCAAVPDHVSEMFTFYAEYFRRSGGPP